MILQSAERARDFARIHPADGSIEFFSESGGGSKGLEASIEGRFSFVDAVFAAFYRDNGVLKFRFGDTEHIIDDVTSSRIDGRSRLPSLLQRVRNVFISRKQFQLIRNGASVLHIDYSAPPVPRFAFDPTPFVEDEDFDFLFFVHRVLNDPERRKNIWS